MFSSCSFFVVTLGSIEKRFGIDLDVIGDGFGIMKIDDKIDYKRVTQGGRASKWGGALRKYQPGTHRQRMRWHWRHSTSCWGHGGGYIVTIL